MDYEINYVVTGEYAGCQITLTDEYAMLENGLFGSKILTSNLTGAVESYYELDYNVVEGEGVYALFITFINNKKCIVNISASPYFLITSNCNPGARLDPDEALIQRYMELPNITPSIEMQEAISQEFINIKNLLAEENVELPEKGEAPPVIWAPTRSVGGFIEFDDNNKLWAPLKGTFKTKPIAIYSYADVMEYELLENGNSITKGGIGRAVAGGVLFGGVGAIVGGVTGGKKTKEIVNSMKVKITTRDPQNPSIFIDIINFETKKDSMTYKSLAQTAQEILSIFAQIVDANNIDNSNQADMPGNSISSADEIRKYKELLDDGIITEEEFQAKKKELLGI